MKGPFAFLSIYLSLYLQQDLVLNTNSDLVDQQDLIYLIEMILQIHKEQIKIHKGGLSTRVGPNSKSCRLL